MCYNTIAELHNYYNYKFYVSADIRTTQPTHQMHNTRTLPVNILQCASIIYVSDSFGLLNQFYFIPAILRHPTWQPINMAIHKHRLAKPAKRS